VALWYWVTDPRGAAERDALRFAISNGGASKDLTAAIDHHKTAVKVRAGFLIAGMIATPFGLLMVASILGGLLTVLAVLFGGLAYLGWMGRPLDRPVSAWAVSKMETPKLTPDLLITALKLCGVADLKKAIEADGERAVRFLSSVARTANAGGKGYEVDIELPSGVYAGDVVDKRPKLSSGIRRHESCVWPSPDPERHAGCLRLYVADKPLSKSGAVPWPLLRSGLTDVFERQPIGVDERGEVVMMTLMWGSGAIGAVPRVGKSYAMRVLNAIYALDPSVEIHFYDWKGGGDHDEVELVAHTFISGADEPDFKAAMADLDHLIERMNARYALLRRLIKEDRSLVPEKKVTRELANRRDLDLWPIYIGMDEAHEPFTNGKDLRKQFEAKLARLERKGPAVGITVWKATQRVDDASIPSTLMAIAPKRVALCLSSPQDNNMILGAGMYAKGYRATAFSLADKGVSWVVGDADNPQICRWPKIDSGPAEKIFERARAERERRGWLSGMAAGEELDPGEDIVSTTILVDMTAVWPLSEYKIAGQALAERLSEFNPGRYLGWTAEQVTKAVKPFGMEAKSVWVSDLGKSLRGYDRDALIEAYNTFVAGLEDEAQGPVEESEDDFETVGVAD
jgi:S-DNA-T family DNA segregation ATPase FtsK/SpoIIIE